jgi:hypothetical protein
MAAHRTRHGRRPRRLLTEGTAVMITRTRLSASRHSARCIRQTAAHKSVAPRRQSRIGGAFPAAGAGGGKRSGRRLPLPPAGAPTTSAIRQIPNWQPHRPSAPRRPRIRMTHIMLKCWEPKLLGNPWHRYALDHESANPTCRQFHDQQTFSFRRQSMIVDVLDHTVVCGDAA